MRQPHALDLNESVRELETMLRRLLEADVRIELDLDASLAPVEADSGQLAQMLANVAVNARDAMAAPTR